MKFPPWKWFIEFTHPTQAHMHGIKKYIYCGQTKYQSVEVVEIDFYGKALILDGKIQSAAFDEYIYHEALIHPAMVSHARPENILVLGGGEGASLREILKYDTVENIVMVDIDREVVEICRKYLPEWSHNAFENPKITVVYEDARKFVANTSTSWDIVVMDLTEPVDDGPSYLMFTREFFQLLRSKMAPDSILVLQAGSFSPRILECHVALYNTVKLSFPVVKSYHAFIPSFDVDWGFLIAATENKLELKADNIDKILLERGITGLKYFDGETSRGMFSLPKDIRRLRAENNRIIEDNNPLITF